jgi:quercetin 2,3-dioxygenase
MITLRRSGERGRTKLDWLDSRHTFSFGEYRDQRYMGFRDLRVINDDRVSPGEGFGTHSHRDMEIVTYVLEGSVEHKDSTGTQTTIIPGEVQRMSAGTGISHSEYNPSNSEPVHFLQIWILPGAQNLPPSYEQRAFDLEKNRGRWTLVAAKDGRDGAVTVHQDVALFVARLLADQQTAYRLKPGRYAWLQIARGSATLNGATLGEGDGAAASDEEILEVRAVEDAEVLIFDLA